ncbi:MAG: hypothetical protein CVV02_02650 [Firmicutes bacterium HGW-Firmicutes-7]|nr:MAG: hypothetical protein CVV02_02650 [Firmicutes bacterium HGW-Firmicutes-7]
MEHSIWYIELCDKIDALTSEFTEKETKKYQINWLKKLLDKLDYFQESCSDCVELKNSMDNLLIDLELIKNDPNHSTDQYFTSINNLYQHLKTSHKVVVSRHYVHLGIIAGVIIGLIITFVFKDLIPGTMKYGFNTSIIIGFATGFYLDKKATSEYRMLV